MGKAGCQSVPDGDVDVGVGEVMSVDVAVAEGMGVAVAVLAGVTTSCGAVLPASREARLTAVVLDVVRTKLKVPWVVT